MAKLNYLNCETRRGNVGKAKCGRPPKVWIGGVLIPKGRVITANELADFPAFLKQMFVDNDPLQRFYPVGKFVGITDNSEEQQDFTYPDGSKVKQRDAVYDTLWQHRETRCYHNALRSFDGAEGEFDFLSFDKDYFVGGTQGTDEDGNPGLAGYDLSRINVPFLTMPTYDTPAVMNFGIALADGRQLNELYAEVELGEDLLKYPSVTEAELQDITPSGASAGVFTIAIAVGCGATNLASIFGSDFALAGNFSATNPSTGNAITITSVALNAAGTGYTLTLNTSDTDYPASGNIRFALSSISTLATAGFEYYAAEPIFIPRS